MFSTAVDGETATRRGLSKEDAERLYLIVMPLRERNLYMAMEQERFAGRVCGASDLMTS